MSMDNHASLSIADLNRQLKALTEELAAVTAANARARRVRQIFLLLALSVSLVIVVAFYNLATRLVEPDHLDRLASAAEKRLQARSDDYLRQVQILVDHTSPALSEAFGEQVKKDLPKYLKIAERERDELAKELEPKLSKMVEQRYERALKSHEAILRKEFPAVDNDVTHARMSRNLLLAIDKNVQKHYGRELETQFKTLYATWDNFPATPPPRPGEPPLEEQLTGNLLRLLTIKLTNREASSLPQ
jgi:hypothetical protein